MHNIEEILKTFETAQITATRSILNNEMYAKVTATKTNTIRLQPVGLVVILLIVFNVAVYNSLYKNEALENNKTYSKVEVYRELSNELLVNPSQHK